MTRRWLVDGNNVFGSRPDGWWNDRGGAMLRFGQAVAEWCRTHDEPVTVVFDPPVPDDVLALAGGNLTVSAARRRGRNAADDTIVDLAAEITDTDDGVIVVSSDKGLRDRLPTHVGIEGVGVFRERIGY